MAECVARCRGKEIVEALIAAIRQNRDYLSEIDGAIGDGDHGVNMNKGFTMAAGRLEGDSFSESLEVLGTTLLEDIGGSMGPLYGGLFLAMSEADDAQGIGRREFGEMLALGLASIEDLSPAKPGDKTLMDALVPAKAAYFAAMEEDKSFSQCLDVMKEAAEKGRDSTKDMVARLGRASRLGERSRGVLDAGAVSCCILLTAFADALKKCL